MLTPSLFFVPSDPLLLVDNATCHVTHVAISRTAGMVPCRSSSDAG